MKRSFEDLMRDNGFGDENTKETWPERSEEKEDISDEEVDIRAKVFLNGWQEAEKEYKKLIENISSQLNKIRGILNNFVS